MATEKRRRLKGLSINKMIPNILTVLALCAGLTAIRYGLDARWQAAVAAIIIAGVLDGLDGRIARILGSSSKFGAELDSLSDVISFGVAPAFLLYLWTMNTAGNVGWIVSLLFTICCGLRLARFNTMLETPPPPNWGSTFFVGVPAPAAAGLVLLPMIVSFQFAESIVRRPEVAGPILVVVAALMVSRVPTYSFKQVRVPYRYVLPILLFVGFLAALVTSRPWFTLLAIGILYIVSIPLSVRAAHRLQKRITEREAAAARNRADAERREIEPAGKDRI